LPSPDILFREVARRDKWRNRACEQSSRQIRQIAFDNLLLLRILFLGGFVRVAKLQAAQIITFKQR
jgi:hypothetical protein